MTNHFEIAESLLAEDEEVARYGEADPRRLLRAQVHATLALAQVVDQQRIQQNAIWGRDEEPTP
jgi:hypothetical protein